MNYDRQKDVFNNEEFDTPIHVIGAGAIGSWVALQLAKMGVTFHIHDFDKVMPPNLPNQAFCPEDLGKKKVAGIKKMCYDIANITIKPHTKPVDKDSNLSGIVFLLIDTIHGRKDIWEGIKNNPKVEYLIETRMGATEGQLYCVDTSKPDTFKYYENTIQFTDEEASASVCGTSTSVIATAMRLSSEAVWAFINHANGRPNPKERIFDASTFEEYTVK